MRILFPPVKRKKLGLGVKEGVSKMLSYSLAYGIDSKKTLMQIHGFIPKLPMETLIKRWTIGITSCSASIGFIYYIYYTVYNSFLHTPFAGILASIATSFVKLPVVNSLKLVQSAQVNNVFSGITQLSKGSGLYKGYSLIIVEDAIELDIKNRLYNTLSGNDLKLNVLAGTFASAFASAITTPFDNIRLSLLFKQPLNINGLYNGIGFRVSSNITKNLGFFIILEILKKYFD